MKKILIQLDTDPHPSPFDAIAAYDAGVDVVLGFAQVSADKIAGIVQGAIFPRGPQGLADTAFWIGGSKVRDGEAVFTAVQKQFFEPFKPSIMLDSDGSNTTAAAAVARVRHAVDLNGSRAAVIGVGPVGLRTAELLRREGAEVTMLTFPPDVIDGGHRRASGIPVAQEEGFEVIEPASSDELDDALAGRVAVFAAGPAGTQVLRRSG
ncbi:MAG: methylene-tetrahydromethanopterin dehydrogenase N-terminal domain-containing protein, partial [Solirubrobacteraceae bacterium]